MKKLLAALVAAAFALGHVPALAQDKKPEPGKEEVKKGEAEKTDKAELKKVKKGDAKKDEGKKKVKKGGC